MKEFTDGLGKFVNAKCDASVRSGGVDGYAENNYSMLYYHQARSAITLEGRRSEWSFDPSGQSSLTSV